MNDVKKKNSKKVHIKQIEPPQHKNEQLFRSFLSCVCADEQIKWSKHHPMRKWWYTLHTTKIGIAVGRLVDTRSSNSRKDQIAFSIGSLLCLFCLFLCGILCSVLKFLSKTIWSLHKKKTLLFGAVSVRMEWKLNYKSKQCRK